MNITAPVFNEEKDKGRNASLPRCIRSGHKSKRLGKSPVKSAEDTFHPLLPGKYCAPNMAMVGASASMRSIYSIIKMVGMTTASVLITGESGTGKELVARAVHSAGVTKDEVFSSNNVPFVAINCGALPAGLMESELFGHERGAFTGASVRKTGKVELASGGTLFLDEVATMPLPLQVKLLRFLQERVFTRVGGNVLINADIRVIAAANVNLLDAVKRGEFREDLYYRLNVVPIEVPALRERREDISLLARHFLEKYSSKYSRSIAGISREALAALTAYGWPGNVRELENIMERIVVLSPDEGPVMVSDLPAEISSSTCDNAPSTSAISGQRGPGGYREALMDFERAYITSLLEKTGWNRARTARLMKVHRNTLLMKMKALEVKTP